MSVCETVLPSVSDWTSSHFFSSPLPLPQDIGSTLTLLIQSGIFNCACYWVSVHQLPAYTLRAGIAHTYTHNTGTLPPANIWSTTASSCSGFSASSQVSGRCFMSSVILFGCACMCGCVCACMCGCVRVCRCVCRCVRWPWSLFIQHCSIIIAP